MARKNISTLKGWTITKIVFDAGYYTLTLTKGAKTMTVSIDRDQIFDGTGDHFNCNV